MDGGLANPVPANVGRQMGADIVIAVDVSSKWMTAPEELASVKDIYSIMSNALSIIEYQIAKGILKDNADIVLRPPVLHYDWTDFDRAADIIKTGEKEIRLNLQEIRRKTGHRAPRLTLAEKFFDFITGQPER